MSAVSRVPCFGVSLPMQAQWGSKITVHDFHAPVLHLRGLEPTKLTYRHAERDDRLSDVRDFRLSDQFEQTIIKIKVFCATLAASHFVVSVCESLSTFAANSPRSDC